MDKTKKIAALITLIALLLIALTETVPAITEQSLPTFCTFAGSGAGAGNTPEGNFNAFFGYETGNSNSDGDRNTFVGAGAGHENTSGGDNVFIGRSSGYSHVSGNDNTFVGANVAYSNIAADDNTFIGSGAGHNSSGSGNVFIGNSAGYFETDGSNRLYIANSESATPLIYGEFDNKLLQINGSLVFASSESLKKNIEPLKDSLSRVMLLQGITFAWHEQETRGKGRNTGLIAQDVEPVIPELVHTGKAGYRAIAYDRLAPILVEAIKEQQALLRKQKENLASKSLIADAQKKAFDGQNALISDLAGQLARLREDLNKLKSRDMAAEKWNTK